MDNTLDGQNNKQTKEQIDRRTNGQKTRWTID